MKKLSDYKGEEAIELWADLIEPFVSMISNDKVKAAISARKKPIDIAKVMLKENADAGQQILLAIDPTPVDGVNAFVRIINILLEMLNNPEFMSFFGFAVKETEASESSGNVTENTEAQGK